MPFIGNKPTAVPLTSADLADSIITSAKIADGTIVGDDINSTFDLTGKTVTGAGGITMADQWRLTTAFSGGGGDITSNLERNDTSGYSGIGTGMTESSGIFTFPTTGIYLVTAQGYWSASVSITYASIITRFTINNSTYLDQSLVYDSISSSSFHCATFTLSILDVTDTANCKVKFVKDTSGNINLGGSTSNTQTGFTFIRLGDT